MRWFVRGDIDGFFGLAVDNLVQLLLIDTLCRHVLGFPDDLLHGQVLPGVAVSLLIGNLYYAWQARDVARKTGRDDLCALPYGINTVSVFAHVFLVMLPAKLAATAAGAADPVRVAWQAGLLACLGSGLIELAGSFVAERLRKATPRAALLSTLAGVALGFISIGFLFRTFARPMVGLTTLAVLLLVYFGRVRFRGGVPGGLVAVALGTLLAWVTGIAPVGDMPAAGQGLQLPVPVLGELFGALRGDLLWSYLAVIIPMGIFNVVGSLQNIEGRRGRGRCIPDAALAGGQRRRHARGRGVRLVLPDHDLHRSPRLEGDGRARRLLDPQRRVRDPRVPDRHARVHRLGGADRGRHGDRPVDRYRDRRPGVPGHPPASTRPRS
jgi:AGZA family xanthine/uracil permease-like MFS transporter